MKVEALWDELLLREPLVSECYVANQISNSTPSIIWVFGYLLELQMKINLSELDCLQLCDFNGIYLNVLILRHIMWQINVKFDVSL